MGSAPFPLPATIGRFKVEALVGRGGMGEVYRAFDPTLQRTVALKTVRPDMQQPQLLARLYREAQALARLQHPNIVTVHEAGELDGVVYIAMEFLKGVDLATALRRGGLGFEEKIRILIQVLGALEHAHGENVIHRDIKPSNILRQPDGTVTLVDFGLARIAQVESVTLTGAVMATIAYASPEQLKGQALDPRTDIYSVGAVAYEFCTGRCAFVGENDTATAIILKVVQDPLPPMNVVWSAQFPEFERIVARAMAKSREDRYQSARQMREALAAFLNSSHTAITALREDATVVLDTETRPAAPAVAAPATPPPVERKSGRRVRPAAWAVGGLAAVAVIAAALMLPREEPAQPGGMATPTAAEGGNTTPTSSAASQPASEPGTGAAAAPPPATPTTGTPAPVLAAATGASAPVGVPEVAIARTTPSPSAPAAPSAATVVNAGAKKLFYADSPSSSTSAGSGSGSVVAATNAGLKYRVIQQTGASEIDVDESTTFKSGDRVRFSFESNIQGYLYVVTEGSSGNWNVLFPDLRINSGNNVIQPFEQYRVPSSQWFEFRGKPGIEKVFVILSKDPMPQVPGLNRPVTRAETLSPAVVKELQGSVLSRDLVLEEEPGGSASQATYVVNRTELGKVVTAAITLTHGEP